MGIDLERFYETPSPNFCCQLCKKVLDDPVMCPSEHVFCRPCIKTWLDSSALCPEDKKGLAIGQLKNVLRPFRELLNELKIKCVFVDVGCKAELSLATVENHTLHCKFKDVVSDKEKLVVQEAQIKDLMQANVDKGKEIEKVKQRLEEALAKQEEKNIALGQLEETYSKKLTDLEVKNQELVSTLDKTTVMMNEATYDDIGSIYGQKKYDKLLRKFLDREADYEQLRQAFEGIVAQLDKVLKEDQKG